MAWFLARKHRRGMRNPLEWIARCCGDSSTVRIGGAAIALRRVGAGTSVAEEEGEKRLGGSLPLHEVHAVLENGAEGSQR